MHLLKFWIFVSIISVNTVFSIPVLPGHFNAHALDSGMSMVDIEKDVVLSPGRGGNNFNAEAEDEGHAVVTVGGAVHGFAENRTGEEFNAISKTKGTSQVRVNGDLLVENLDPAVKKFDAVSQSHGQSLVQVGNVVILAGSRGARFARQLANEAQRQPAAETPWGAAAVADHNSKPWETVNHGPVSDTSIVESATALEKPEVPGTTGQIPSDELHPHPSEAPTLVTSVTTPSVAPSSVPVSASERPSLVPDNTQIQENSHQPESSVTAPVVTSPVPSEVTSSVTTVTTVKPAIVIVPDTPKPHPTETVLEPENNHHHVGIIVGPHPLPHPNGGYSAGSLNAVSTGHGSKSVVLVKGFVQY